MRKEQPRQQLTQKMENGGINSSSGPYLVADRAASDRSLLVAIDALLRSGRVDAAISVLERELGGGC